MGLPTILQHLLQIDAITLELMPALVQQIVGLLLDQRVGDIVAGLLDQLLI